MQNELKIGCILILCEGIRDLLECENNSYKFVIDVREIIL